MPLRNRRSGRLASSIGLVAFLAGLPAVAMAHAVLIASVPAIGATVRPGPTAIDLRYNSRIDARRSQLTLSGSGGAPAVLPITPGPHEDVLTTSVTLAPGAYVLRWQVLAVDGHITRGDVPFTVGP
jgi:methionine-rich copper-binding protein CopC